MPSVFRDFSCLFVANQILLSSQHARFCITVTQRAIGDHRKLTRTEHVLPLLGHFGFRTSAATAIATVSVCESETSTSVALTCASSARPWSSSRTSGSFRVPW